MSSEPTSALRSLRLAQGLTLKQLAAKVDIDPAQLSRIERGVRKPSVETLTKLANALGLKDLSRMLAGITK